MESIQLLVKAAHWNRIYLKEVAKVQNGYAFSSDYFTKSEGMPLIRIRDIDSYTTVDKFNGKYNQDFVVKKGDILIGMDGDFKTARWKGENGLLNQRVCRIIPCSKDYNDKFLVFCLQPFLDAIHAETSSVTVKHISSKTIEEIPLPLPPKKEQDAIVSKIEELFSGIEKGIESLFTAQQQLKTYRQSVLKWAFEGKLTNSLNYDSNDLPEDYDLTIAAEDEAGYKMEKNHRNQNNHINHSSDKGKLPKGWKWVKISDISHINPKLPNKENINEDLEIQFLPMKLVEEIVNKIHLDEIKTFKAVQKKSYTPFINGDIIFAKVTPCMENGKIAIVENLKNGIGYGSSEFHVLRCSKDVLNKYVFYFLVQDHFRNEAQNAMTGAVGLRRVPKQFIENHAIPLPPTTEQNEIVEAIESRLSVADKMEESINQSLQQAEALKQSILKKAFEGRLIS